MAIPQSFIDELINKADIVDVISNYIALKKSGSNYFGLCPFHGEKTPSFSVSTDKQIFHCFGCSEGGGAISFIMKIENLSYVEAINYLAKMYNLTVPEDNYNNENAIIRRKILEMNKKTARFFYNNLLNDENENVRNYLKDRGINKKNAMVFGVGYANNSFNDLLNYLVKDGYTKEEILKAGLASQNEKGNIYDRFRGRVIFPIIDIRGEIVAFGGRVLDDSMPKYLNSPETLAYSKSYNLFALNIAKKSKKGYIILGEGYMDVIALHKAGFDSAVASLGTSLTEPQARLLKRFTNEVIIAYDSDKAGQVASNRAIEILKKAGINVRVLQMKNAKDPDEYIQKFGSDSFSNLVTKSENDSKYKYDRILEKYNFEEDLDKIEFVKEIVTMLSKLSNSVEREIFATKASEACGISKEAISLEFAKYIKSTRKKEKNKKNLENMSPINSVIPKTADIIYKDVKSAMAEEGIISLIFTDCTLLDKIDIDENRFSVDIFRIIFTYSKRIYKEGRNVNISYFYEILDQSQINHLASVISKPQTVVGREEALNDYVNIINIQYAIRSNDIDLILKLKSGSI